MMMPKLYEVVSETIKLTGVTLAEINELGNTFTIIMPVE
jgi:hypothetical protein